MKKGLAFVFVFFGLAGTSRCSGLSGRSLAGGGSCPGPRCCWTKQLIQEHAEEDLSRSKLSPASYEGRIVLYKPGLFWPGDKITDEACSFSLKRENGTFIVVSSIFPHPVPLKMRMHPRSEFYIGAHGENDVFVFQYIQPGRASLTHTSYNDERSGEIGYANCGKGVFIKECSPIE